MPIDISFAKASNNDNTRRSMKQFLLKEKFGSHRARRFSRRVCSMSDKAWALTAAVAVMLLLSCSEAKKEPGAKARYKTMVVATKDVTLQQQYSARLTGRQIVEVRPQVSGTIMRICINEGDHVRRGQTLFIIDQVPFRAALEVAVAARKSAEAKLSTARMNYDSERQLLAGNVVSDFSVATTHNALAEAEAQLAQARAQETNARWQLSCTEVKSPVDGVASMIPWHVGALVGSTMSEPLVTVADVSQVYAYFSVTERQALDLTARYGSVSRFVAEAPAVGLLLSNGESYAHEGHIDAVSGTVDDQTGAVALRATFPNPDQMLRNGGAATLTVPTRRQTVIVVPQAATYELQNRTFVYRVLNGKTKSTPVTLFPLDNGHDYIVEQGLSVGDTIVAEGAGLLKEGVSL